MKFAILLIFIFSPIFAQENNSILLSQPPSQAPEGFDPDIRVQNRNSKDFQESPTRQNNKFESIPKDKKIKKQHELYRKYRMGFDLGAKYGQADTLPYTDVFLSPYLKLDQFFIMYEIPLRFDWTQVFDASIWKGTPALVSKIEMDLHYSKTNHWFRQFQASIYQSTGIFMGHGRLFNMYTPNNKAPYETYKTAYLGMDFSYVGLNAYVGNIANPHLIGTELFIRPLAWLKNPKAEFYKDLKIYGVFGLDLQPYQQVAQGIYNIGTSPNGVPPFMMFEAGLDIPIYRTANKIFALHLYMDYAQFLGTSTTLNNVAYNAPSGSGFSTGLTLCFIERFSIRAEVSQGFGAWQPHWIDSYYQIDQLYLITPTSIFGGEKYNSVLANKTFYEVDFAYRLLSKGVFLNFALFGEGTDIISIKFGINLSNELLKLISLDLFFIIRDLKGLDQFLSPTKTIIHAKLNYHMQANMTWGVIFRVNGVPTIFYEQKKEIVGNQRSIFLGLDFAFRY